MTELKEWQTGTPEKHAEIIARSVYNCTMICNYFDGAWRNVWNGAIIDFDKVTIWQYVKLPE